MEAWQMSPVVEDQRLECRRSPNRPVAVEALAALGVFVYRLDPNSMLLPNADGSTEVDRLMGLLGYPVRDEVCCSPDTLQDYDNKIRSFFVEHAHEDDEVRLIKAGIGFFDVRDADDEWVRIRVTPGDLLILPAGIYHRFTLDTTNFVHAIRLFSTAPRWVPLNRPCDDHPARMAYVSTCLSRGGPPYTALVEWSDGVEVVRDPISFSVRVRDVVKRMRTGDTTIVYFRGAPLPRTTRSWCGDCIEAEPTLLEGLGQLKDHLPGALRYVEVVVERESYRGHDYPLRSHPFVQLKAIPLVLVLKSVAPVAAHADVDGAEGVEEVRRFKESVPTGWADELLQDN